MGTSNDSENTGQTCFPRRRDDVQVEELDGEAVLYDQRSGSVHRFNNTTLMIWDGCSGSQTPRDIAAGLVGPHSISIDEALKVVDSVIAELEDRDLLQHRTAEDQELLSSVGVNAEPPKQSMSTIGPASSVQRADATETTGRQISHRGLLSSAVMSGPLIGSLSVISSKPPSSRKPGTPIQISNSSTIALARTLFDGLRRRFKASIAGLKRVMFRGIPDSSQPTSSGRLNSQNTETE